MEGEVGGWVGGKALRGHGGWLLGRIGMGRGGMESQWVRSWWGICVPGPRQLERKRMREGGRVDGGAGGRQWEGSAGA